MRIGAALLGGALVFGLFPLAPAQAAPTVELLNPSDYSTAALVISTKEDEDDSFHLVAWAGEVPADPVVEFELQQGTVNVLTETADRVGADTFEFDLEPPQTVGDGQYILRVILYSGATEVARSEEPVMINSADVPPPPPSDTVEMTFPDNGEALGFVTPQGKAPNAVIAGTASAGTAQVRVLYTKTAPGADPEWQACGSGRPGEDGEFRARCTLAAEDRPDQVRAVAAVANKTPPPGDPSPVADDTGDAHRVIPYVQVPTAVEFAPSSIRAEVGECRAATFQVVDQQGQPIAGLNVDVHAQGPDDQLRFAENAGVNSGFKEPDKAHPGTEATVKCAATDADNRQGEHGVPAGDDIKHIESTSGTDNAGRFTAVLRSDTRGGSHLTAWADVDDDDSLGVQEVAGRAQIGWGEAPPEPEDELFVDPASRSGEPGSCQRFVAVAQRGDDRLNGRNVDVHITGPSSVQFCNAEGSSTRSPDSGDHAGDQDAGSADTRHNEGETDSEGRLVFGVMSIQSGRTEILAWLDSDDDDDRDGTEKTAAAEATWGGGGGGGGGDRDITIHSSRSSVRRGKRVRLFGTVDDGAMCRADQAVQIQAKARRRGRFRTIRRTRTEGDGDYSTRVRVNKTRRYRAVAPANARCERATSRSVRVRAR